LKLLPVIMLIFCSAGLPVLAESPGKSAFRQSEKYYIQGKADKALPFVDQALTSDPNNPSYLLRKVQCLHQIQEDEEALPIISKLLLQAPDNVTYLMVKTGVLGALGRFDEALACAQKAYRIDSTVPELNLTLARILLNCRKFDEAQILLTKLLKLTPGDQMLRVTRIKVGVALGKWEQVVEDCSVSLKSVLPHSPALIRVLTDRAVAYQHLKRYDLAVRDYEAILRFVHDYRPAHVGLKDVYKASGDRKKYDREMKILEKLDYESALSK